MVDDLEKALGRELREVADGLRIPTMPALPEQPSVRPHAHRHWLPLLVAAVVVLVVAGAVGVGSRLGGDRDLEPGPPAATPSSSPTPLARTAPSIPYVLDEQLYVDGVQVPGTWWSVKSGAAGWIALGDDGTWSWGTGPKANKLSVSRDDSPVISPNGQYIALVTTFDNGRSNVTGFDVRFGGDGLGAVPVYPGPAGAGDPIRVRAVTDDGKVIVQGSGTNLLWLPRGDNSTVDLNPTPQSAPAAPVDPPQVVLGSTPAGLVVVDSADGTDGASGQPYLASISDAGEFTGLGSLPPHDDIAISPAGWLLWVEPGSLGGEVAAVSSLQVQNLDGTGRATLRAPSGWDFRVMAWAWEDDEHVVAPVVRDSGKGGERMVRCGVLPAECVLIDAP